MSAGNAYCGPLSEPEVESIGAGAGVTLAGMERVRETRNSQPASSTDTAPGEVRVKSEFRSQTMGMTFDCRDISGELPRAVEVDMDDGVLEAWPHPPPIRGVRYIPKFGAKPVVVSVQPFLLIIGRNNVDYDFVISGRRIGAEVAGGSTRYVMRDGQWTSPPLNDALERFGIGAILTDTDRFSTYFLRNVAILHRPSLHPIEEIPAEKRAAVSAMLGEQGWANRRVLLERNIVTADELNIIVANRLAYFPLHEEDYTDLPSTFVFRDRTTYELWRDERRSRACIGPMKSPSMPRLAEAFTLDGLPFTVTSSCQTENPARAGEKNGDIYYEGADRVPHHIGIQSFFELEKAQRILRTAALGDSWRQTRPEDIETAKFRLKVIHGEVEPIWPDTGHNKVRRGQAISLQTIEQWRVDARKARNQGKSEIDGLLSNERLRGNRCGKIEQEVEQIMAETMDSFFEQKGVAPTNRAFASEVQVRCSAAGFGKPTRRTTDRFLDKEDRSYLVACQKGPRARYETDGFVPREFRSRIIDAGVPFMLAHADHTPIPFKCPSVFGNFFYHRQLWLSVLVDQAEDLELAFMLSYDPPNSMNTAILLLLCAHRWGGLVPTFLATDNGPDFCSTHVLDVLSEAEVHHLYRPKNAPRFGSIVELSNNALAQNLRSLAGDTQAVNDFYRSSPGFRSQDVACMTLPELSAHLTGFFDSKYDVPGPHTLGMSRRAFRADRFRELGTLQYPHLKINDDLLIRCMPYASHGGTRIVRAEGYVECNSLAYYGMGEGIRKYVGTRVWVKPDRFCAGRVWVAPTGGTWHECRNQYYETIRKFTQHEAAEYIGYLRDRKVLKGNDPVENGALFHRCATFGEIPDQLVTARRCTRESLIAVDSAIFKNRDPLQLADSDSREPVSSPRVQPLVPTATPLRSVSLR